MQIGDFEWKPPNLKTANMVTVWVQAVCDAGTAK